MLTQAELDAIREREQALEPEEWEAYFTIHCDPFVSVKGFPKTHFRVSTAPADYGRSTAIFIAHARKDIPALLAHVAELEAKLAAGFTEEEAGLIAKSCYMSGGEHFGDDYWVRPHATMEETITTTIARIRAERKTA